MSGFEESSAVAQAPLFTTMPSTTHRPGQSIASPSRHDSKRAAIRRGDLKISEPIQLPREVNHGTSQQFPDGNQSKPTTGSTPQLEGTWPRKTVSPGFHTRIKSNGDNERQSQRGASHNAISRISAGPSVFNGSLANAPSKGSLSKQKDGGLKAKIRRMFGSKRLREASLSSGIGGHPSYPVS